MARNKNSRSLAAIVIWIFALGLAACGGGDGDKTTLLHLGDNEDQPPLYGQEFTTTLELVDAITSATLKVEFMGEQENWGGAPEVTVSGVDYRDRTGEIEIGALVYVNGENVGLVRSDIPEENVECVIEWVADSEWEYICPFTFSLDVTGLLIQGENTVSVVSTWGDDFVIGDVSIQYH